MKRLDIVRKMTVALTVAWGALSLRRAPATICNAIMEARNLGLRLEVALHSDGRRRKPSKRKRKGGGK